MDASQNAYQVDIMGLTSSLDEMERHLFNLGQKVQVKIKIMLLNYIILHTCVVHNCL